MHLFSSPPLLRKEDKFVWQKKFEPSLSTLVDREKGVSLAKRINHITCIAFISSHICSNLYTKICVVHVCKQNLYKQVIDELYILSIINKLIWTFLLSNICNSVYLLQNIINILICVINVLLFVRKSIMWLTFCCWLKLFIIVFKSFNSIGYLTIYYYNFV